MSRKLDRESCGHYLINTTILFNAMWGWWLGTRVKSVGKACTHAGSFATLLTRCDKPSYGVSSALLQTILCVCMWCQCVLCHGHLTHSVWWTMAMNKCKGLPVKAKHKNPCKTTSLYLTINAIQHYTQKNNLQCTHIHVINSSQMEYSIYI